MESWAAALGLGFPQLQVLPRRWGEAGTGPGPPRGPRGRAHSLSTHRLWLSGPGFRLLVPLFLLNAVRVGNSTPQVQGVSDSACRGTQPLRAASAGLCGSGPCSCGSGGGGGCWLWAGGNPRDPSQAASHTAPLGDGQGLGLAQPPCWVGTGLAEESDSEPESLRKVNPSLGEGALGSGFRVHTGP